MKQPVNEPLINWRSIDGDYALSAIRNTGGWASYVSDKSMISHSKMIREKEGLKCTTCFNRRSNCFIGSS